MPQIKKNNKIIFQIFLFSIFHFLSCGLQAQSDWTKLNYHYNVGSLPPPYHYSYTITINGDGKGEMVYIGGYESTPKNTSVYPFELNSKKMKKLNKAVKESDVLNLDIKTRPGEEIPDGGHSDGLEIYGVNKESDSKDTVLIKSIPTYPELKYDGILNRLYKAIQNSVPDDIWKEIDSKKGKEK